MRKVEIMGKVVYIGDGNGSGFGTVMMKSGLGNGLHLMFFHLWGELTCDYKRF